MIMPNILAASARAVSLLVAPDDALYRLAAPLHWELHATNSPTGAPPLQQDVTRSVGVFIEGLQPEHSYRFSCGGGTVEFSTLSCTGVIDAAEFGVTAESADNSAAFAAAIVATPVGGTLRLGPGVYRSGPIFLRSQMTLHLEEGAVLEAISDRSNWPVLPARDTSGRVIGTWEGIPEACYAALITAERCHNLCLTGRGKIDGGGDRGDWWQWPKETRNGARRPRTLHLAHCEEVQISGLTICNSPSWTVHPYECRSLDCSNLSIENPPDSPNTDGLNPESSKDVMLRALHFSVGDDCIAIKAGKRDPISQEWPAATRRIKISHCLMERGHGAVVLGSEMSGGIYDVDISNCEFEATDRGLRLKTRRGRGGIIANVHLHRVVMRDVPTPIAINAYYYCDPDGMDEWVQSRTPARSDDTTPMIRDITLTDLRAHNVTTAAVAALGLPEAPIIGVSIHNFAISYAPKELSLPQVPLMALHVPALTHADIWSEFAQIDGHITQLEPADPHFQEHEYATGLL